MSENITQELPKDNNDKLDHLIAMVRNIISGLNSLDTRLDALEKKDMVTKPLWEEMRAEQTRLLEILQSHTDRMTQVEEHLQQLEKHLQQQDEKNSSLEEKIELGFRRLGDKIDVLNQDGLEVRADVRHLDRRVSRLEPVN